MPTTSSVAAQEAGGGGGSGAAAAKAASERGEDKVRAEWNTRLACGVAAVAYSNLVSVVATVCADESKAVALFGGNTGCATAVSQASTLYYIMPVNAEHFLDPWNR